MLINEKLMTGQFLRNFKNDRSSLLPATHHHLHQSNHQQPTSAPMPSVKMDIYSAYAYQQQLHQHLLATSPHHAQSTLSPSAEVLDLSRRCDSVESSRKTPSPYQTNSSYGTNSPTGSPRNQQQREQQQSQPPPGTPINFLYSSQAHMHQTTVLDSLHPLLYYPRTIKTEPGPSSSPPTVPQPLSHTYRTSPVSSAFQAASCLRSTLDAAEESTFSARKPAKVSSCDISQPQESRSPIPLPISAATSPSPSNSTRAAIDAKSTRPFKAFPRDPLVIAANFAATDVLLDNPRVERYTEYRKRVLEQIRHSNGGTRTVTNPKMRRTNSLSGRTNNSGLSYNNSESEERHGAEESSDCDSTVDNFDKMTSSTASTSSTEANNNNTKLMQNSNVNGQVKDAAYYERRRKNNAAAKKSRDRRRIKEDEIAIRAAYLERQNIELLCQIDSLKAQLAAFTSKVGA